MSAVDAAARQPQRWTGAAVHSAVRSQRARPRLHQGLSAGTARERRAVYPRIPVDDARVCATRGWRSGRRTMLVDQSRQSFQCCAPRSSLQGGALCGLRRCLFRRRAHWRAAGPGTRARRVGCTALRWKASSESTCEATCSASALHTASLAGLRDLHYRYRSSGYQITVLNPRGVNSGIAQATLDGQTMSSRPCDIGLLDDGLQHQVRITLG